MIKYIALSIVIKQCKFQMNLTIPQHVNELAGVVRISNSIWIPLDFQSFQVRTMLPQTDHDLINVYTGGHL